MEILYHYCGVEAFFNILRRKRVWLSGANNFNDYSELQWGIDKVFSCLNSMRSDFPLEDIKFIHNVFLSNNSLKFICSLSEEGDLLSQWRAYAENGGGLSIGFNKSFLPSREYMPHSNVDPGKSIGTYPVIYDNDAQDLTIREIITSTLNAMRGVDRDKQGASVLNAVYRLTGLVCVYKNPAFSEEREWRMVHSPILMKDDENRLAVHGGISPIKQRVSAGKICTYFEYDFTPKKDRDVLPVLEVVKGPKCAVSDYDLFIFLSRIGFSSVQIKKSVASYR